MAKFLSSAQWNLGAAAEDIFMESGAAIALQNWLVYQDARSGIDETEEYLFPSCKTATWDEGYGFWHTFVLGVDSLSGYVSDYLCLWIMTQQDYLF